MPKRKIPPIHDIFRLEAKGYKPREIARSLGVIKRTAVYDYCKKRKDRGLSWDDLKDLNDYELVQIFNKKPGPKSDKVKPDFDALIDHFKDRKPKRGRKKFLKKELFNLYEAIYKERAYGKTRFHELLAEYESSKNPSMFLDHVPGEMGFDFCGKTLPFEDEDGSTKDAYIFEAILAVSSKTFLWACRTQEREDVIDAIARAITFFGVIPDHWKHDNMPATKTAEYRECVRYYDAYDDTSRAYHSQDNAMAENGVGISYNHALLPLSDRVFPSLADLNSVLQLKVAEINQLPFQEYPGNRDSRFIEKERPYLDLAGTPFIYYELLKPQLVRKTCTVKVKNHHYSVPTDYKNKHVDVRVSKEHVEVFYQGERVAFHKRSHQPGEKTRDLNHLTKGQRRYLTRSYEEHLDWASQYGEGAKAVVEAQFKSDDRTNPHSLKTCRKLQTLALKNKEEFEAACQYAIEVGSPTLTRLRDILGSNVHKLPKVDIEKHFEIPAHRNIRGASYYSDGGQ